MSRKTKLVVVTERGRVVGTQRWRDDATGQPVTAVLRAGPGQQLHVLEDYEVPDRLEGADAIRSFHEHVERYLRSARNVRSRRR